MNGAIKQSSPDKEYPPLKWQTRWWWVSGLSARWMTCYYPVIWFRPSSPRPMTKLCATCSGNRNNGPVLMMVAKVVKQYRLLAGVVFGTSIPRCVSHKKDTGRPLDESRSPRRLDGGEGVDGGNFQKHRLCRLCEDNNCDSCWLGANVGPDFGIRRVERRRTLFYPLREQQ